MRECECGCGECTRGGVFKPGHDQRLLANLQRRIGGILSLRDLVDASESYVDEKSTLKKFGMEVKAIFRTDQTSSK